MRAGPIRSLVLAMLFSFPLLATPVIAQNRVVFPSDPKTVAECDGPALQMRAMQDRLAEQHRQKFKETEATDFATGGDKYRALMNLIDVQGAESSKLRQEHNALEKACRTAARKNEQIGQQALRELKEGYAKAKRAYEQAKSMVERIQNSPADAYAKRNEAHSAALESQMNTAKQYILDFQPKAEIVGAIQDASFFQLKSEVQQLNGDITALESAIQTIRSDATADAPPAAKPATTTSTGTSVTEIADTLQRGVDQAVGWLSSVFSGNAAPASATTPDSTSSSPSPANPPPQAAAYNPASAPAPRALSASEQCAATAQSCNSGCMGVAALGLLSLFTRNNAAASEASNQTQLCSNRCDEALNICEQQASGGQSGANQPGASLVSAGSARGLPVAECHRQANASGLGEKLNAIPRNETVLLLRGSIYNLAFLIKTYTQCLPDRETQNAINGWTTQRDQALRTCRQISSVDNCLVSPFR